MIQEGTSQNWQERNPHAFMSGQLKLYALNGQPVFPPQQHNTAVASELNPHSFVPAQHTPVQNY
jgi:hypothetical protein